VKGKIVANVSETSVRLPSEPWTVPLTVNVEGEERIIGTATVNHNNVTCIILNENLGGFTTRIIKYGDLKSLSIVPNVL
jgi:hypothetical protein